MDDSGGNALDSPRLQALKRGYDIARAGAPNTHLMIITPPGINDGAIGTGLGNLAASFAVLPGTTVDWTKTSVAYHLYNNDRDFGTVSHNAANLRNLHSRFPAWPSENAFPPGTFLGADGLDQWRSAPFRINGVDDTRSARFLTTRNPPLFPPSNPSRLTSNSPTFAHKRESSIRSSAAPI